MQTNLMLIQLNENQITKRHTLKKVVKHKKHKITRFRLPAKTPSHITYKYVLFVWYTTHFCLAEICFNTNIVLIFSASAAL